MKNILWWFLAPEASNQISSSIAAFASSISPFSFIHTPLPPSVILLLSKTHQSLVPSFFQLSFQMKTRLTLVWQWHIAAVCHHIPSPQHVLANSPHVDFPLHLFFPYIHPSSKHFLLMTTASSSLSSPYYCWFASFHLSVSVWAASEL